MKSTAASYPTGPLAPQPKLLNGGASSTNAAFAWVHSGQAGLIPWALTYLEHHLKTDPAPFHWTLADDAEEATRLVVAAPRAHAKTTVLALAYVLYRAACFREPFTLIVSDTGTQAEQRTSDLFAELLENEELVKAYPHLKLPEQKDYREQRAKRTTRDFITLGGLRFTGAGAGQSLRGMKTGAQRPSLIVVDDLENDESVRTPEQREKLKNWFYKALLNLPGGEGAQIIMIGTILHRESLLSWLLSDDQAPYWTQRLYRAIQDDGTPLWPSQWTLEALERKRGENSRAFSSEYMNEPVDEGSTLFKAEWLERPSARVKHYPQLKRIVVAVDPAVSNKESSDSTGIVVAGTDYNGHGYVLWSEALKASPDTWARRVTELYHRFEADQVVAEANQGGDLVLSVLRTADERVPVKLVRATRGKIVRAEPIAALFEQNKVSLVVR